MERMKPENASLTKGKRKAVAWVVFFAPGGPLGQRVQEHEGVRAGSVGVGTSKGGKVAAVSSSISELPALHNTGHHHCHAEGLGNEGELETSLFAHSEPLEAQSTRARLQCGAWKFPFRSGPGGPIKRV